MAEIIECKCGENRLRRPLNRMFTELPFPVPPPPPTAKSVPFSYAN